MVAGDPAGIDRSIQSLEDHRISSLYFQKRGQSIPAHLPCSPGGLPGHGDRSPGHFKIFAADGAADHWRGC